jgi:hypothetical protein
MNNTVVISGLALFIGLGVGFGVGKSGSTTKDATTAAELNMITRAGERSATDENSPSARNKKSLGKATAFRDC